MDQIDHREIARRKSFGAYLRSRRERLAPADVDLGACDAVIDSVLATATLDRPTSAPLAPVAGKTGRDGVHTEAMGYILAELQSVARAHPDATW